MVQNAVYIETKQGSQDSGNIVDKLDMHTAVRLGLKNPVSETKGGKMHGKANQTN